MRYPLIPIICPNCGSQNIERIHRSRLEKMVRRNPKFLCRKCNQEFFKKLSRD